MSWQSSQVAAAIGGAPRSAIIYWDVAGAECVVHVVVDALTVNGTGPDLFEALAAARRRLEAQGARLYCEGARRNVFSSPLLRQASNGRYAYMLTMPRTAHKPPTVDIFAPAPPTADVVTVDEQRAWFDQWRLSEPVASADPARQLPSELLAQAESHPGGWVYEIVGDYGRDDAVPPAAIRGGWRVDDSGQVIGEFVPNPNFRQPGRPEQP